jgi:hypothetical protein
MRTSTSPHNPSTTQSVRVIFDPGIDMEEVAGTLELARLGAESLYGAETVELEAAWRLDRPNRCVDIDTFTRVGRTLALIFLGYVRREFGPGAVATHRVHQMATGQTVGGA